MNDTVAKYMKYDLNTNSRPPRTKKFSNRGFTLIEIITVIAILVILLLLTVSVFGRFKERQAIDVNAQIVAEALREARDKTLDSLDASAYGVHLASTTVTVFKGATYSPSDPENQERILASPVIVSSSTISGVDILFERLTGETSDSGSIFVGVEGKSSPLKEIVVESTGLVYVKK